MTTASALRWPTSLPSTWQLVPAKALFAERREPSHRDDVHLTPSQSYGVLPQTEYMRITGSRVVQNLTGQDSMKHVEPDDFIIHLRSFQGGIEWSAINGKVSLAYTVLTPRRGVLPRYFRWVLKSEGYIQEIRSTTDQLRDGQSIKYATFAKVPLPLPPADEQRRIADFLDRETTQIDTLIAKQEQLIAGLSERRLAVIDRATTKGLDPAAPTIASGEKSLGDVPAHWKLCRIKDVGRAVIGLTYAPEDVVSEEDGGTLVLRASNIQNGSISLVDTVYVKKTIPAHLRLLKSDIVICARNGSAKLVGKSAPAVSEVVGQTWGAFMVVLRSSQNTYLRWILSSQLFASQTGLYATSTINQLTSSTLHNLRIALPPASEQESISSYLDEQTAKTDALIAKAEKFIGLARERRAALITEAVTGRMTC